MGKLNMAVSINLLNKQFKKGAKEVEISLNKIRSTALALGGTLVGGLGFIELTKRMYESVRETSKVQTALKNVTDDTFQYAQAQQFLIKQAKQYGLEINSLTRAYAKFRASAQGSSITIEETNKIFQSFNTQISKFGLNTDEANGVFLALSQMMSKGKIQAEELRGQLGERLPGALTIFANSIGVTVGELEDLMKKGELLSSEVLPKVADYLNNMGSGIDTNTIEANVNRMKNVFTEVVNSGDLNNFINTLIQKLTGALQFVGDNFKEIMITSGVIVVGFIGEKFNQIFNTIDARVKATMIKLSSMQSKISTAKLHISSSYIDDGTILGDEPTEDIEYNDYREKYKKHYKDIDAIVKSTEKTEIRLLKLRELELSMKREVATLERKLTHRDLNEMQSLQDNLRNLDDVEKRLRDIQSVEAESGIRLNDVLETANKTYKKKLNLTSLINRGWKSIVDSVKSFASGLLTGGVMTGIVFIATKAVEIYKSFMEAGRLTREFNDALEETDNILSGSSEHAKAIKDEYNTLIKAKSILFDINKSTEYRKNKLNEINSILGTNFNSLDSIKDKEGEINSLIENRIKLKKSEAGISYAKDKIGDIDKQLIELAKNNKNRINVGEDSYGMPTYTYKKSKINYAGNDDNNVVGLMMNANNESINKQLQTLLQAKEKFNNKIIELETGLISSSIDNYSEYYNIELSNLNQSLQDKLISEKEYYEKRLKLSEKVSSGILDNNDILKLELSGDIKFYKDKLKELEDATKSTSNKIKKIDLKPIDDDVLINQFTKYSQPKDLKKSNTTKPISGVNYSERDNTFDYRLSSDEKVNKGLQHRLDLLNSEIDRLKALDIELGNIDYTALLDEASSLKEQLNLNEIRKDVKEFSKEVNKIKLQGLSDFSGNMDNLSNSILNVRNAWFDLNDRLAEMEGGEKFLTLLDAILSTLNSITQAVNTVVGVIEFFKQLTTAKIALESATIAEGVAETANTATSIANNTAKVTSNTVTTASNMALAKSASLASASMIPFPGNLVAMGTTIGTLTALASTPIPCFANGGIVSGDTIARVGEYAGASTNPEVIAPLNKLKGLIKDSVEVGGINGDVKFKIKGKDLVGVIENYNKYKSKIK